MVSYNTKKKFRTLSVGGTILFGPRPFLGLGGMRKMGNFDFFTNIGMLGVYIGVFEHAELIPDVYFDARPSHCPQNLIFPTPRPFLGLACM